MSKLVRCIGARQWTMVAARGRRTCVCALNIHNPIEYTTISFQNIRGCGICQTQYLRSFIESHQKTNSSLMYARKFRKYCSILSFVFRYLNIRLLDIYYFTQFWMIETKCSYVYIFTIEKPSSLSPASYVLIILPHYVDQMHSNERCYKTLTTDFAILLTPKILVWF